MEIILSYVKNNKKKLMIVVSILVVLVGGNIIHSEIRQHKYITGVGLTNTEKSENIKIAILGKNYDKAMKLCNNYYEDNEVLRLQWKNLIDKYEREGLNGINALDMDKIY